MHVQDPQRKIFCVKLDKDADKRTRRIQYRRWFDDEAKASDRERPTDE